MRRKMKKHGLPSNAENCAAIVSIEIARRKFLVDRRYLDCDASSILFEDDISGDIPRSRCQNNVFPIFLAIAQIRFSKHIAVKGRKENWLKSYRLLTLKMPVVKNLRFF